MKKLYLTCNLLPWQKEFLEKMKKGENIVFSNLPRRAGQTFLKNYIKENYPKLYKKYYCFEPIKDNGIKCNIIILDDKIC